MTTKEPGVDQPERVGLVQDAVSRILAQAHTVEDVAEPLLVAIADGMGWDLATLWLIDQEHIVLRCVAMWQAAGLATSDFMTASQQAAFPRGHGLPGQVWAEQQPVWLADLSRATNFPRLVAASQSRLQTGVAFPILVGAEPVGVIECFSRTQRPSDRPTLAAVATLGQQIGQFIGRTRAERAARERAARSAAIISAALDAIVTIDHHGQVLEWNPAAERLFGIPASQALGQAMAEQIIPSRLRDAHYTGLARYLRTGEARVVGTRIETTAQDVAGREFPVELAIVRVSATEPPIFTSYIRDLTARLRHDARQRWLAEASTVLYHSLDPGTTLRQLADLAVPFLADWCIVYLSTDDGAIQRVAMTSRTPDADTLIEHIQRQTAIDPDAADGVPAVIRTGQALLVPEATTDLLVADVDDRDRLRALIDPLGIQSWLCVPLAARGRILGAISCISTSTLRRYDPDDLAFAEDLAHRAALAIDNAQLFALAQQAEVRAQWHAERSQALADAARIFAQATLDVQAVLDAICEQSTQLLGGLCIVRLVSRDGEWLEPAALHHRDPTVVAELDALLRTAPQRVGEGILGRVAREGQAVLIPELDEDVVQRTIKPAFQSFVRTSRIRSIVVVPLLARSAILGTLALFRTVDEAPLNDDDREVLEDLAHRAALALENARLYAEVRQALGQREAFISIASHELKTPLTSMKAAGQLLARRLQPGDLVNDATHRLVTQLVGETTRLEQLVADLLDAARVQQGRLELRREWIDLTTLTRRVLERFEHAPERTARHHLVIDAAGPVTGSWDLHRLDQVLTNLVSNALKYSPDGGEVRIGLIERAQDVEINVSDAGVGIPAEEQAQLFEPFARGRQHNGQIGGVGLGLYITAQIVEQHTGTLSVDSSPGHGSTFRVMLPRDVA